MSYKIKRKTLGNRLLIGSVMVAASFGVFSCSDKYDLDSDDNQPSNLNSIYGYLEGMGNYTTYLRLIDDLGEKEVLSHTGSNTLFAADDDAFARFFADNKWKVSNYESLSLAQKKLLLYSSMIDNPYSTSMLSTADGPIKGEVFRRSSSTTIYDSVLVVPNSDPDGILPKTPQFDELKASKTRTSTVLFSDYAQPNPMIHFNAQFMTSNKVMSSDVDFIYGKWLGMGERSVDDVYVNNTKLVEPNIFCKNGFVHRVSDVLMPLDNMAEAIRQNPNTHLFSSILERFASVEYSSSLTDAYNNNKGTSYDSVFVKRYFSKRSYGSSASNSVAFEIDKNSNTSDGSLEFDPGWNGLYPIMTAKGSNPMMEDMVVMLVPTDAALESWWHDEGGSDIRKFYASGVDGTEEGLNKVPLAVFDRLINAGMKDPFTTTIPSNFGNLQDDAQMPLNLKESDIESVILASNGLIYLTNKVFAPTAYSSVLSPVVIDTLSYSVIANAIDELEYDAYLNSMVSEFTFLLPTNNAMQSYIDPVSFYFSTPQMWTFAIDPKKIPSERLSVSVFNCTIDENGVPTPTTTRAAKEFTKATDTYVKNRLEEMLDNLIITEKYKPTKQYYRTKGNTFVHITNSATGGGYDVSATYQSQYNKPVKVITDSVYTKNNGYTYVVDQIPMGGSNSVVQSLNLHPEVFSDFIWVLENSGALTIVNDKDGWLASDNVNGNLLNIKEKDRIGAEDLQSGISKKVTYLLNNYHYTLYAPTNDAMQQAFAAGLPGPEELNEAVEMDAEESLTGTLESHADSIREVLLDFVKYHIQDNAIFIDEGFASGDYESGKTELIRSTTIDETTGVQTWDGTYSPGRPYKLSVNVSSSGLTVTDVKNNSRNVITTPGMYNIMAREYWYNGTGSGRTDYPYNKTLNNSSFVVIHAIDGPLLFDPDNQFKYEYKKLYQDTSAKRR